MLENEKALHKFQKKRELLITEINWLIVRIQIILGCIWKEKRKDWTKRRLYYMLSRDWWYHKHNKQTCWTSKEGKWDKANDYKEKH